jgi:hypothetical protein
MNSLEILVTARKLISDPDHWTQGSAARTSRGLPTHSGANGGCIFTIAANAAIKQYILDTEK